MTSATIMRRGRPFSGLVQVAGVHDLEEARAVIQAGAHALGIPLRLPVNAPDLDEQAAARLVAALPADVTPVLITYETDPDELVSLLGYLGLAHVQLHASHGPEADAALLRALSERAPGVYAIKSLVMAGEESLSLLEQTMERCAPFADAFITDTYDPATGASGATGKVHDWAWSRRLVQRSPRPVILAGGLTPHNVAEAIAAAAPAGVDAHTGLEGPDGRKDPALVRRFAQEAAMAFAQM